MRRRVFEKVVSSILTMALTIQPALLHAQNIQPVNPGAGPRPHVDQSLNGTTVINISTPNGAGVSHDVYTDFQANDLILNNSATITNTQLGGVIEGNGNLAPGQEANLWIGEVVGGNQTQLGGILEVAGKRMDVVVANEFGITCNGCGFINTGRATLTTGKPQFGSNGALTGFDVRRGTVTIGAGGLNPENRIALTDTSRIDVIARAAAIYGKMRADQLNVVAGANRVDYNWSYDPATGAVTGITEQAGEGAAPALAVDVAALGGMYANAIRLIATENGVGVRLNGDMASSTNIALRADGKLTLGAPAGGHTPQIRAGSRIQVRNQGPILLEGAITSESGDLIDIRTSNGDMTFNGQAAGGAIRLESAGMLNISGAIVAREAFEATSTGASVAMNGTSEIFAQSINVNALTQLTFDGKSAALETASLTAGTELRTGASSELVAESAALTGGDARIEGQVQALENLTIEATDGSVDHRGTSRGQAVTITGDDIQTSDGSQIAAVGDLSVTAAEQAKISGELVAGKGLTLKSTAAGIAVETNAEILAESLNVEAQTRIDFDGKAAAHETAFVSAGTELATGADSELLADSVALTGETAQLSGELRAVDGLTIEATDGAVEHSGVSRGQNVSIIGDTVETGDTSQIAAVDGLTVTATDQILLDGELASGAELAITSTGASVTIEDGAELVADSLDVDAQTQVALNGRAAVQNRAELNAGASLTTGDASEIVAGSIAFSGTTAQIAGQAEAQDSVSIEARDGSLEHSGRSRGRSVTLSGDRVQTGESSQIAAIADLQVTAADRAVIDGTMIAGQRADLSVTAGDLDLQGQINARNTNITTSGQTSLGADALAVGQSVLELQSGSLNGGLRASHFDQLRAGDGLAVTLETGGLTVAASERVEFDGDLLLDLEGDLENRGTIKASGNLQLRSGSDLNNRGGLLKSGETMQLVARDGTVLNQSGRIEADGGLAIEAETFVNRFNSIVTEPSQSGVEIFAGTPDNKTRSRRVSTNPADLELGSCFTSSRSNGGADRASSCATIYSFDGVYSNQGGVTWSTGTSVAASGAKPEILSGAGIAIQAGTVRNDAGLISAEGGIDVQSSSFANNGYQDTRVTHTATYTRNLTIEINEGSGGSDAAFTTRTERVTYSPISRETSNGATSEIGQVLAGGAVNINSASVVASGDIRSGTASVVPPRENSNVTQASLPDLIVPASSLTPVQPDVLDLPALAPVQPDVVTLPSLDPVQPKLQTLANLDALIGEGRTNFGTMPVSYEDLLSSDYFLDRLQIQNELFQNINRPTEWNGYQSDGVSFDGENAVQTPGSEFVGFGDRFGLSESGVLASLDKANASESGDLKITAGSITGSGGSLIAEGGSLSLTSFGNIDFEDTELGGDLVNIITGGDFSGKALVIRSTSDTSIFAAGNVVIAGLAQTEEYYTNTSVTKITENLASRFDVGGDLSIISSADMTLAGVQAQVTGDTRLTAGGSLYLLTEQSGVQYSEGDAKNGTDRLTLTAQVTQLSTGGDFIANAGGDAVLIGTQIDAGGKAHLAAAGDVVLAAAQDIAKSETRKTSRGFLSKKKETRSTLAVTNRGVGITAGGDIDIVAETGDLTTAGTELASASGDINLTATEGNILVGTYTDVFEETHTKEKSYLGGLLSKSSQLHTVDHINTGTDALAALDLSIVSGSDTTLVGATLSAGQNLNIKTGGDFSVQAAIDSHRSEFFETDMGLVTMTTITETSFTETAVLTELLAGQGMSFDIGGDAELVVYQNAGVDAPNPQDLYPEELLAIDGLELISQELADEYFYEEKTQLSPAFKALVAIAVAAYVAPNLVGNLLPELTTAAAAEGATALTTGLYNGATAFTSTALVETLDGVVAGDLDLGAILEAAAFSGVSAGLTSGINLNIPENSPLNDALINGFGNGDVAQLTIGGILEGALDGAISSGLSSTVYGTDFAEGFSASLVQTVTNLALADAQFEIGGLFTDEDGIPINGGEGSAGHMLLHALAGCAAAEASGADCKSGAAGGIAASIYSGIAGNSSLSIEEQNRLASVVGAVAGYLVSGGEADNVSTGSFVGQSAVLNNYLKHTDLANMQAALEACHAQDGGCSKADQRDIAVHFANVGLQNDRELANTCFTNECIDSFLAEAVSYDEAIAALSSESPYAAQLLSVSGALFVSGPAQQQLDQNIDFLNGYEDYQETRCGGVSDGACAEAYTEAYAGYLNDVETVEATKQFLAVVTGAVALGPSVCAATPRTCVALGVSDVIECASGNITSCSPGPNLQGTGIKVEGSAPNRAPVANPTAAQIASAEKLGVDTRWVKSNGEIDWPPNYGFEGPPTIRELQPGQTFDRYGGRFDEKGNFTDRGAFVAPRDVPFDQRSLPDSSKNSPYRQYEVLKPIPQVNSGSAAPWFGKTGGGTQYQLPMSIDELVKQGFIRQLK
ncbi:two-partner secretion domain-containing protein [Ruegeria arenilitoris]|uniref:two-partner secretion domain-containing protein n=1 Tax=Ruegeria arenilitoris TaxID=1173585 RepID=UPI001C2BE9E0|nr:glycohydrolase toxin TNT-related protein [Ruegeria arenilitoris]